MAMQLPDKAPLSENVVITSREELAKLVSEALSKGSGAFLKAFAKDSRGKYYLTVLFDRTKVLAAECLLLDSGQTLIGADAVELFKSILSNPMVVDVYALDEIELKMSVAENLEAYSETPKVQLSELFGENLEVSKVAPPKPEVKPPEVKPKPVAPAPKPAPQPAQPVPKKPEVIVNFTGGTLPESAFQKYAENIIKESQRIKGLRIWKIEFDANVGEGVVYLNVRVYGTSESGNKREIEIAEKRVFHIVSKHAPVLLREAEVKPILRDISVVINGREVKPQEIVETEKKKEGNVTADGRIRLSVLEDVWPYFSNFAKTVVQEIEEAGIKVTRAYFDVRGRREFEVNLAVAVESSLDRPSVEKMIRTILTRHARELGRTIARYISVHRIDVELIEIQPEIKPTAPTVTSTKAAEILAKKELLEKEVEKLLKEAGIEELSHLTETKKREAEQTLLKSRIEPAIETLKSRVHAELKLIPRATFKWLKLNHEVQGGTVYVDMEASFAKENVGGLFGAYSAVSDEKIKQDIRETVLRIIREVSREYGVPISLRRLNVILR
ncbi:hypothetical protein [Thermococcus sp.]|uniref:hypothetical protein n=1 Tax=Thermococcus sp. TaxID=35749 RepID=UPI003458F978